MSVCGLHPHLLAVRPPSGCSPGWSCCFGPGRAPVGLVRLGSAGGRWRIRRTAATLPSYAYHTASCQLFCSWQADDSTSSDDFGQDRSPAFAKGPQCGKGGGYI